MDIEWPRLVSHLYHMAIAYVLAVPIGPDRKFSESPASSL